MILLCYQSDKNLNINVIILKIYKFNFIITLDFTQDFFISEDNFNIIHQVLNVKSYSETLLF